MSGEIVDICERTNPGTHVVVLRGDQQRPGVADRWGWTCRCGSKSLRNDMTIPVASADFARHYRDARRKEKR